MNIERFEQLVEGATETQRLEFKGPCEWSVQSLAKDIMAMANIQDGGHIVIGITDDPVERVGLTEATLKSYAAETMRDQMAAYADPHVQFDVEETRDEEGKRYITIRVHEFEQTPVICRKDGRDAKASTIYYRNKNRRVESAAISNSHDLRDLVMLAASKLRRQWESFGLKVDDQVRAKLDEELGGL